MRRLSLAGFKNDFVRPAIFPDWWDETCDEDPSLLPDIEIRVARFLGLTISEIRDSATSLVPTPSAGTQLRRVRNLDPSRLTPAIHATMQVASAVARSLRSTFPAPTLPPLDGLQWREQIQSAGEAIGLDDLLDDLWGRGIPIVPLDLLPTPNFQGLACVVEDRPMILLGHKHDEPGRIAFFVAHETGHIAAGDCSPDSPIIDEEEAIADNSAIEKMADQYAKSVLVGDESVPNVAPDSFHDLAKRAVEIERSKGINASTFIFTWARRTGNYPLATMAVKALYQSTGARQLLRKHFDCHVDLDSATESDRALLHCVFGDPERNAVAS